MGYSRSFAIISVDVWLSLTPNAGNSSVSACVCVGWRRTHMRGAQLRRHKTKWKRDKNRWAQSARAHKNGTQIHCASDKIMSYCWNSKDNSICSVFPFPCAILIRWHSVDCRRLDIVLIWRDWRMLFAADAACDRIGAYGAHSRRHDDMVRKIHIQIQANTVTVGCRGPCHCRFHSNWIRCDALKSIRFVQHHRRRPRVDAFGMERNEKIYIDQSRIRCGIIK